MAATFNESQQIDYLWKKLGYGVAKTAGTTGAGAKQAYNESIASPLLYRGDLIWTQSGSIPASPPSGTTSIVEVYKDGGGAYSPSVECSEDLTSPDNQTWLTNLANWIPTQFGDNYLVQIYAANVGVANPQTVGTQLFQSGSGNDDTWFFDYQAGVLNFNGANIPSVITGGVAGKSIYVVGYQYVGIVGLSGGAATGTSISNGTSNVNVVSSGGNVTVGIGGTGNVAVFSTTGVYLTGELSATANVTGSNLITGGQVSAAGNVTGNYILGNAVLVNGVSLSPSKIFNGISEANIGTANGNANISINGTSNVAVFAGTGAYITGLLSATGNILSGNVVSNAMISALGNIISNNIISAFGNIIGGNILSAGMVSAAGNVTGNNLAGHTLTVNSIASDDSTYVIIEDGLNVTGEISAVGNIMAATFVGNGIGLTSTLVDRGSDSNNYDTITQMGVYTVNRTSWTGTVNTPLDSQIFVGLLEVKNSTDMAIEQIFYPGTIDNTNIKMQYSRAYFAGVWTPWVLMTNDGQTLSGGEFS